MFQERCHSQTSRCLSFKKSFALLCFFRSYLDTAISHQQNCACCTVVMVYLLLGKGEVVATFLLVVKLCCVSFFSGFLKKFFSFDFTNDYFAIF
ncbi:hypothetical protein AX13_15100 [Comamonas aquatica DA1877]|uniref:Uncharacterized protein n=1 Tax=Comamonas aquatica DA1877 TaxID=1457173 RepID=A0A014P360_9BURK|nr:hypothetical protein AX13_15100 [Comamonas aquatica DA1877]